jgi:hypothetical protein
MSKLSFHCDYEVHPGDAKVVTSGKSMPIPWRVP